ncbi:MAG TPA: flagellar basal body protein FliL, partial [Xanthomonadaceae bacterium]|nr:flagellar basal body protein FliL [Xanthomonadaceae bacterium]
LDPAFVVNLNNASSGAQFLQVEIQLMTRDPAALEVLKQQAPGIRAKLLMQLSQVNADSLTTLEGKEALRKQALASVKTMMTAETGKPIVEDLVFTSFVMQ